MTLYFDSIIPVSIMNHWGPRRGLAAEEGFCILLFWNRTSSSSGLCQYVCLCFFVAITKKKLNFMVKGNGIPHVKALNLLMWESCCPETFQADSSSKYWGGNPVAGTTVACRKDGVLGRRGRWWGCSCSSWKYPEAVKEFTPSVLEYATSSNTASIKLELWVFI